MPRFISSPPNDSAESLDRRAASGGGGTTYQSLFKSRKCWPGSPFTCKLHRLRCELEKRNAESGERHERLTR